LNIKPPAIARLAPLLPQLVVAFRRRAGDVPDILKAGGSRGERHIAAMMSLAIAGPATVSELGTRLNISTAHASLVVGELARSGVVEREHRPDDRRHVVVRLSDAARPAVAEMRRRNAAPLLRFLSELTAEDAEQFITHLALLVSHLVDDEPTESPSSPQRMHVPEPQAPASDRSRKHLPRDDDG
jgi:DNA-binding MarR family transcriptional regulator